MSTLKPRTQTPALAVETVDGDTWKLEDQKPENFTMIVAYRGLHCPICRNYLSDLNRNAEEFAKRGVKTLVVSTDDRERAEEAKREWKLDNCTVGYGLGIDTAREWGLYVSTGRGKTSIGVEEPEKFNEPGVFLVRPDGTLYAALYATMPFARPHFKEILSAVDTIVAKDYPARGEA
jgi:peroxiredoxin